MNRVLDAWALIAFLRGEKGADLLGDQAAALEAVASVPELGVVVRTDLDQQLWMDVAHRRRAHRMSLCDGFGIALACRLSADFVSSDHHELDPVNASGSYVITFFR